METKSLILLFLSLVCLIAPMIFAWFTVFPLGGLLWQLTVVTMFVLLSSCLFLLTFKFAKVKRNLMYAVIALFTFILPLGFAYLWVSPFLQSTIAWVYLLMHFIFAMGVITAYANYKSGFKTLKKSIKSL